MTVPRVFHFVFGLRPQTEPFHVAHYLCLESCRRVNQPDRIMFHYHHEPHGPWWDLIKPHLDLRQVQPEAFVRDHRGYLEHQEGRLIQSWDLGYAHESDFIRVRALIEHGGVYADMDTLFVQPLPESYFGAKFVIGEEDLSAIAVGATEERSLCNAFMVSEPDSRFASEWLQRMYRVFDGTWSRHSCQEATLVASEMPGEVTIVGPSPHFYFLCTVEDLKKLFGASVPLPAEVLSIHLWAHLWWSHLRTDHTSFHAGMLDEHYVRRADTTYAIAARPFLP